MQSLPIFLVVVLLAFGQTIPVAFAQNSIDSYDPGEQAGRESDVQNQDELDLWRGSLIGINLQQKDDGIYVTTIQSEASAGGFQVGDRVSRIGTVDLQKSGLEALRQMLAETPPGTRIPIAIFRDNIPIDSFAISFRPELIDVDSIDSNIRKNLIIKKHLTSRGKIDLLEGLKSRMLNAVRQCDSPRAAQECLNKLIDELDLSHSAYVPACSMTTLNNESTGDVGVTLRRFAINGVEGYFVIDLKPASPAFQSSLRLGDRVETINGTPIELSRRLVLVGEEQRYGAFGLRVDIDETIQVQHRHSDGDDMELISIQATDSPSPKSTLDASVRVVESSGCRVGYIRLWNLMTPDIGKMFRDHVKTAFADCEALVVDLRGRGGQITVVLDIEKTIRKLDIPVVLITDEMTRSAKEILAFRLKRLNNVFVIGERTSGAVTGASFVTLPSGNTLMMPVQSADSLKTYIEGEILEGVGVEPDERIDFFEPFCNGQDRLLEAAIKRAPERIVH